MTVADDLEHVISPARFAGFVAECNGDREMAAELYCWSAALAGAFHVDLGRVEVAFRNRIDVALTAHHARLRNRSQDAAWFDGPRWTRHHWWDDAAQAAIDDARRIAHHRPWSPRPDAVVAALGFGFWRYLVSARYEQSLWTPVLDRAFVGVPGDSPATRRRTVERHVRVLVRLRNRVAHHEPVHRPAVLLGPGGQRFMYSIDDQVTMIADILGWLDAVALIPSGLAAADFLHHRP